MGGADPGEKGGGSYVQVSQARTKGKKGTHHSAPLHTSHVEGITSGQFCVGLADPAEKTLSMVTHNILVYIREMKRHLQDLVYLNLSISLGLTQLGRNYEESRIVWPQ